MKVKSECEVAQSCPTLRDPMDCSLPGKSTGVGCHCLFQIQAEDPLLECQSGNAVAVVFSAPLDMPAVSIRDHRALVQLCCSSLTVTG